MSKVKVITNTNVDSEFFGELITPSQNREGWGSVAVEQQAFVFQNGILNNQRRVALIQGEVENLEQFLASFNAKEGTVLPGKIVVKESLTPFYEGQAPKVTPDGDFCVVRDENGQVHNIYRRTEYDATGEEKDVLVRHTDLLPANTPMSVFETAAMEAE